MFNQNAAKAETGETHRDSLIMKGNLEGSAQIIRQARCDTPLVSVVLPTYNRASLLSESIDSVISQTERDFELIIVNDGSSDASDEIIKHFAHRDDRLTYIRQNNLGLPRALNNGFRLARGQLFTWTSDDNRYLPEALTVMSRYMSNHAEAGFVYAELVVRKPEGLIHLQFPEPENYWAQNTFGGAFMYRRSVAEEVGEYDPDLAMVEDYDYFLRLSYHTIVRHLPDVVYEHREHPKSLTNTGRMKQFRALEKLLRRHVRMAKAKPRQLSDLAATVSRTYRLIDKPWDATRIAMLAWRLWPFNLRSYRVMLASLGCCVLQSFKQTVTEREHL